ncbi:MAG: tetratricopeptide repeat protein [Alistipes sp.]|nr:tetratricopeptide repeat protein [Alistipes sp.]
MRKKIFLLSLLLVGALSQLAAQNNAERASVLKAVERGVALYDFGHWIESRTELLSARGQLSSVRDRALIEKIDYYVALCDVELKMVDSAARLKRFLAEYHSSPYKNDVQYALGAYYCMEDDVVLAKQELSKVNYQFLSPQQRDRYDLRMGYMAFMEDRYADAKPYFARIAAGSDYADHATYYTSYMAYAEGDLDASRQGFQALTQSPIYRDLMPFYLMQIDFKDGDYRAVVAQGDALMERTTEEQAQQIRRIMAESWFQLDDYAAAVKYMNAYRSAGGEMGRLENYIIGYSLYRQALYSDALPHLREACGADDMLTQNASYHLADCYLRAGDKTNAVHSFAMASSAEYDKAIAEDALFNYGKLLYEQGGGHFNEAINVLNRYMALYPSSARFSDARKLLIAAYYNSHNYADAYDALKSMPNPDGDALLALQKIAYFNGLEAYTEGELAEAEASLKESLGTGSSNAKYSALASFWLGEIAYAKGDVRTALQRYRNFVARAPKTGEEYAMAQYNMGYCYFNDGDMASASKAFEEFLKVRTKSDEYRADAYNRMGDVRYATRQYAEAVQYYDRAIASNQAGRYYAQYQRAITLGVQNKTADKIAALQSIVRADRGDYIDAATYELGRTYIMQERYADGVRTLEEFVAQYPTSQYHTQALSDLGLAYMNLGERDKALEYYDRVVKSSPQSSQSKSALQGIRDIYMAQGNADGYFAYAERAGLESNVSDMTRDSLSYAAAQKLYLDNKTTEAAVSLRNYLNNYPKGYYRNDALFFLSDCHVRDGRDEEAMASLSELAAQGHTQYSERVLERLATMCYERERYEEAAKAYRSLYDETQVAKTKTNAASGYISSTLKYADDAALVAMADDVERMSGVTEVARRKARHAKASVLLREGKQAEALEVFKTLSSEVKSAEGAEARYRLIEAEYAAKRYDKAEEMVYAFSDSKTPQNYWLAKSFILLGDIYMSRGDSFQARATYQSVVDGYSPADDGIVAEAKEKIAKME